MAVARGEEEKPSTPLCFSFLLGSIRLNGEKATSLCIYMTKGACSIMKRDYSRISLAISRVSIFDTAEEHELR